MPLSRACLCIQQFTIILMCSDSIAYVVQEGIKYLQSKMLVKNRCSTNCCGHHYTGCKHQKWRKVCPSRALTNQQPKRTQECGEAPMWGQSGYFCPEHLAQLQRAWQPGRNTRFQPCSLLQESQQPAVRTRSCRECTVLGEGIGVRARRQLQLSSPHTNESSRRSDGMKWCCCDVERC
jgi:hypothetical protein